MKKILFLIHDLSVGGAEKVLVSLVNHMNRNKFDITVISLFGGGVNEQFLLPHIHYRFVWPKVFPGNSKLAKLFTPEWLHRLCIKEHFDIEVAYLEGPVARIVSGCPDPTTRLFCWIHIEQHTKSCASASFRSYKESKQCYKRFEKIVCVSESVKDDFLSIYPDISNVVVRYNTIDTEQILRLKEKSIDDVNFSANEVKLVAVGKISKRKGIDRLTHIVKRLLDEEYRVHLYLLGVGGDQPEIEDYVKKNGLGQCVSFLGYKTNPYKYISRCDLFVCASLAEGFSTAATEALVLGIPICTVEVSGMKEMLGEENEYGVITDNCEDALYEGIKRFVTDPLLLAYYRNQARKRGMSFSTENTVKAVEAILEEISIEKG